MQRILSDAVKEYQNGGIQTLIKDGFQLINDNLRGYQKMSVNGLNAKFYARNRRVRNKTKSRFTSERKNLSAVLSELRHEDVFYDIGANTGLFSIFADKKIQSGEIVGFEPYPPNVEHFKKKYRFE